MKYKSIIVALISAALFIPTIALAAVPVAKQKAFTGVVTKAGSFQLTVRTSSAAVYTAEINQALLARKNGSPMKPEEILVGDKVEVAALVWPDGSANATAVRNLSLYVHNGTFTGKVVQVLTNGFVMQAKDGLKTVTTDSLTVYKKNGSSATLNVLEPGISVKVKGTWERDNSKIAAKSVEATVRLVNIEFSGQLVSKSENGFTVVAENAIYGVSIQSARLTSKNGKSMNWDEFRLGDTVKVSGKHISEKVEVTGSTVKDLSISK